VVIGGVFNSGLLTAPRPGATYDYAPAARPVLDRALRLLEVTERHGVPLRAAALRFPFGHRAVAGVLTGARSPKRYATPSSSYAARSRTRCGTSCAPRGC
jgi:D-threo-aldose 1-dehydrogenase